VAKPFLKTGCPLLIQDVYDGAHYKPKTSVGWSFEILKQLSIPIL
jgi:hypothetical protein